VSRKAQGLRAWLWQRVSAVYLVIYVVVLGLYALGHPPADYIEWRGWMSNAAVSIATGLFIGALLIHAWVGSRDIVMDYVPTFAIRVALLGVIGVMLTGSGLWALRVLYAAY
jgi:succinate dehydrogenase / fumarate reductase membrane anchor subunit